MFSCFSSFILITFSLYILSLLPITTSLPCIGVTYSAPYTSLATSNSSHLPQPPPLTPPVSPERIVIAINSLKLSSLRLEDSDPTIIRSFLYSNATLFLTIPNYLVSAIAANRSTALRWLYIHVVHFFPRAKITTISVGNDFVDVYPDTIDHLMPAINNIHFSLCDLGIRRISVSTSFSFVSAITTPFPPSSA